ncbi:hypothetical protein OCH80_01900 [Lactobacillus sp. 23-2]
MAIRLWWFPVSRQNYPAMKSWVDWISRHTTTPNLWTGCFQFGD